MMCRQCYQYGHTIKYCKNPITCRNCGEVGHGAEGCNSTPLCFHCKQLHVAGYYACPKQQHETLICQLQQKEKICHLRAIQLLEHNYETIQVQTNKYATHFTCTIEEGNKRKMTPWMLEKCIQQQIDMRPISI